MFAAVSSYLLEGCFAETIVLSIEWSIVLLLFGVGVLGVAVSLVLMPSLLRIDIVRGQDL
jgi:peptidoglycan biosynthesis protein MviN/MurJ (putative lipid II flippase)